MPDLRQNLEISLRSSLSNREEGQQNCLVVLASSSPRRHELIKHLRLPFLIVPSLVDEVIDNKLAPDQLVQGLAGQKAQEVYQRIMEPLSTHYETDALVAVLGADTIVVLDGHFLGKPADKDEALSMLLKLSGRCHEVYTGVEILVATPGKMGKKPSAQRFCAVEVSKVFFRPLELQEIRSYIQTEEPMDKAGSYALQGTGSAFVSKIDGCVTNIIGLPIPRVVALLREAGITVLGLPGEF